MRKDSLVLAALAALLIVPGCASTSDQKPTGTEGLTPDQASAILSGSGDVLGNTQPSFWQRMTSPFFARNQAPGKRGDKAIDPLDLSYPSKDPDAELYTSLAIMSEKAGQTEQAFKQLDKALAVEPNNLKTLITYGQVLERQGKVQQALTKYQMAVNAHPKSTQALNDLGICQCRLGRLNESANTLAQAVRLQPDRPLYRNNLATVLTELGRHDDALAELAAVNPLPIAHYNLGTLLHRRGEAQAAATQFAQAATLDPSFAEAQALATRLGSPVQRSIPASYNPSRPAP